MTGGRRLYVIKLVTFLPGTSPDSIQLNPDTRVIDNIIRGLGAPSDELAVNCENNDIPSEDWAHV